MTQGSRSLPVPSAAATHSSPSLAAKFQPVVLPSTQPTPVPAEASTSIRLLVDPPRSVSYAAALTSSLSRR